MADGLPPRVKETLQVPLGTSTNLFPPRATNYRTWPGLTNPRAEAGEAIVAARERLEQASSKGKFTRSIKRRFYSFWRKLRQAARVLEHEITRAPKRTILEIFVALPVAALAINPYRTEWIEPNPFGWWLISALVLVGVVYAAWRRSRVEGMVTQAVADAGATQLIVIDTVRYHVLDQMRAWQPSPDGLLVSIRNILQAVADLVRHALHLPPEVRVQSNLMVRMPVKLAGVEGQQPGYGIVAYNVKGPAEPSWTLLAYYDIGAGEAFEDGCVRVVEDTRDPEWCGIFDASRSRCFASFPIMRGNDVIAVLNIDASRERVLTVDNANHVLHRMLSGTFSLIADLLYATYDGAIKPALPPALPAPGDVPSHPPEQDA